MKAPKGSGRELAPEGTHQAVCIQVLDLGTQPSGEWGDKRKIQWGFELLDEATEQGEPFTIYMNMTFSASNRSTMAKHLKVWQGVEDASEFEQGDLLGKNGLITIVHNDSEKGTFANVQTIAPLTKNMKPKKSTLDHVLLSLDPDEFDEDVYNDLPDFIKEKIAGSPEWAEVMKPKMKKGTSSKAAPAKKAAAKKKK